MSTKISLKNCDTNEVIFFGQASTKEEKNSHIYEFGNKNHKFIWKIYDKGLIIDSISDVKVHLVLIRDKQTKGYIETEFGNIDLNCYTDVLKIENGRVEVRYTFVQEEEQVFHFCLKEEFEWNQSTWN